MSDALSLAKAFGPHLRALGLYQHVFSNYGSPVRTLYCFLLKWMCFTLLFAATAHGHVCVQKPWLDRTHGLVHRTSVRSKRFGVLLNYH